jgi:hypothetical protein
VIGVIGIATDTSVSWSIAKHIHDKWVEGGPVPCYYLNSVERALAPHCMPYQAGLMKSADLAATHRLPMCPLAMAARDSRLWPALPELIEKGAMPEACAQAPLVELAQMNACPDFSATTPQVRESLQWLAQADARAIHHDVMRMLTCPNSRAVGFDQVVVRWVAQGQMPPGAGVQPVVGAASRSADHAARGSARSWRPQVRTALDPYEGKLRSGFEEAFRSTTSRRSIGGWRARPSWPTACRRRRATRWRGCRWPRRWAPIGSTSRTSKNRWWSSCSRTVPTRATDCRSSPT